MNNIIRSLIMLLASCALFACSDKELPEDAVYDPRFPETDSIYKKANDLYGQADHVLMYNNYLAELYIQTTADKKIQLVPNFDNVPKDLSSTFNIIRNKDGNIMYVAEFPYSEKGDWENIYENIFDDNGDLIMFVRKSSFIQNKVPIYEKSEYFYNSEHKLVKKTYLMKYGKGIEIPQGIKVEYSYRFPYEKYKTRKKWLYAHSLDK